MDNPYLRVAYASRVMSNDAWLAYYSAFNALHEAEAIVPDIRRHHYSRAVAAGIVFC